MERAARMKNDDVQLVHWRLPKRSIAKLKIWATKENRTSVSQVRHLIDYYLPEEIRKMAEEE